MVIMLFNYNSYKNFRNSSILVNKTCYNVLKRFMQKNVGTTTSLIRQTLSWQISINHMEKNHVQRRLNLTQHDNIQDTKTGKVEAIMNSAQNKAGKILQLLTK